MDRCVPIDPAEIADRLVGSAWVDEKDEGVLELHSVGGIWSTRG